MNNLAFAQGMKPVFRFSYDVGGFGAYDRGAIRRQLNQSSPRPNKSDGGGIRNSARSRSDFPLGSPKRKRIWQRSPKLKTYLATRNAANSALFSCEFPQTKFSFSYNRRLAQSQKRATLSKKFLSRSNAQHVHFSIDQSLQRSIQASSATSKAKATPTIDR